MTRSRRIANFGFLSVLAAAMTWPAGGCSPGSSSVPEVIDLSHRTDLEPELAAMIEERTAVVRLKPTSARERALLGALFEANGMWKEARIAYMNATTLDPDEPMWPHHAGIAWLHSTDMDGATAWLQKHTKRFPRFAPLQYRLGTALLEKGDLDGAEAAFKELARLAPQVPHGFMGQGEALLRREKPQEAVPLLEKAVALEEGYKPAHYLLGRAYRAMNRLEEAERELTLGAGGSAQPITDAWSEQQARFTLGVAGQKQQAADLIKARQYDPAIQILEKVIAEDPGDIDALLNLGTAYLHRGHLQRSQAVFLKVKELDDSRFETYINLSACSRRLRQFDAALQYADQAIALAPEMAAAHYARGTTLLVLRRNEEALESLKTALGYNANVPLIHQDLANVYSRLGRHEEAVTHFERLAKLLPTRWEPHLGLGKVLLLLGRKEEARREVEIGLKLAPNEPRLLALAEKLDNQGG